MDLVRELLFRLEASHQTELAVASEEFTEIERYHLKRMAEARLVTLNGFDMNDAYGDPVRQIVSVHSETVELSWHGHDFIDAVRDEGIWSKTKRSVAETSGSVPFEVLKQLATAFLKKKISQHTGLDL